LAVIAKDGIAPRITSHERSHGMHREEMIMLAGRYVIGLLSKQDATDTEERMETDPAFCSIVAQWHDLLADLNDLTEPIEPSSDLWERIVRQLKNPPDDDSPPEFRLSRDGKRNGN
jgi:anti-sigma-K factor RskA